MYAAEWQQRLLKRRGDKGLMSDFGIETPKEVAIAIADMLDGRRFCDLGARDGRFLESCTHYAASVCGIEINQGFAKTAREHGLDVKTGNFFREKLPEADVYYNYPMVSPMFRPLIDYIKRLGAKGIFIFGAGDPEGMGSRLLERYGFGQKDIETPRGVFRLYIWHR